MQHLFATKDFPPVGGGMARRYTELCRHMSPSEIEVSTVREAGSPEFDRNEHYTINRQPFSFTDAKRFPNQMRWGHWLRQRCRQGMDLIHCGNIRPVGYAVWWAHLRTRTPYLVYVNGHDVLKDLQKVAASSLKRLTARSILGNAAGIVATSAWTAEITVQLLREVGVHHPPPIAEIPLGTDPVQFNPARDTGEIRRRFSLGAAPLLVTVARLVPHKGQDVAIHALALLKREFPSLTYLIVGDGDDVTRLRELARELDVAGSVVFAPGLSDEEVADAYATASVYVGPSRIDRGIHVEGFGISFIEAGASGIPVVAGRTAGIPSAVSEGVTGFLVSPTDPADVARAVANLLRNPSLGRQMGREARRLVESRYNWQRVTQETLDFANAVLRTRRAAAA